MQMGKGVPGAQRRRETLRKAALGHGTCLMLLFPSCRGGDRGPTEFSYLLHTNVAARLCLDRAN